MKKGYFGEFGGQFVPELLMPPLRELEHQIQRDLEDNLKQVEQAMTKNWKICSAILQAEKRPSPSAPHSRRSWASICG